MIRAILAAFLLMVIGLAGPAALPAAGHTASTAPAGTRIAVPGGSYMAVTPRQLAQMLRHKHFLLVNVHIPYDGEIAGTDRFIPFYLIDQHLRDLPANKHAMIMLYCRSGRMSGIAARQLVLHGFTNVWHLAGGMEAWQQRGLPLLHKPHA